MPQLDTAWRTRNVGRLLFSATILFMRVKLQAANVGSDAPITETQSVLLQHLDRDGTRLTRIAARAVLPKQSVGESVDRAAALGLVERRPDPADGRAKIVAFTPAGFCVLNRLRDAVAVAERRMADVIGEHFLRSIKIQLGEYIAAANLSAFAAADLTVVPGTDVWRSSNVGRLMVLARRLFVADVLQALREGGAECTEVQLSLFRNIDLAGTRLTDIARRAGMTKQAMVEIVDRAVATGLVERRPDTADRRAKIVGLTSEGRRLLDLMGTGVARAEERLAAATDPTFVEDLRAALRAYTATAPDDPLAAVDQDAPSLVTA